MTTCTRRAGLDPFHSDTDEKLAASSAERIASHCRCCTCMAAARAAEADDGRVDVEARPAVRSNNHWAVAPTIVEPSEQTVPLVPDQAREPDDSE